MSRQQNSGSTGYDENDDRSMLGKHGDAAARARFGGVNIGAAFFGWLVAIAIAILLTSIAGALAAAFGLSQNVTQSEAQRQAGTIGLVAAIVLVAVLLFAYYAGGYVAGRMSRFDGAKQGFAVWLIGLLVVLVLAAAGAVFGARNNGLAQPDLPRIPVDEGTATTGAVVALIAILLVSAVAAVL